MATKADKKHEDWMQSKWRPAMGWLYMATCAFDFVIFPVLHGILVATIYKGHPPAGVLAQWAPLTLQGAGLYHLAMGAVLGVAAWSRGQEKMAGATGSTTGGFGMSSITGGMSSPSPTTSSWGSSPSTPSTPTSSGWGTNTSPTMSSPQPLPPPPTKPGVRLSSSPSARTVLPDTDDDPDLKIK